MRFAPFPHPALVLIRIAVIGSLLRAVPAPVAGLLAGMATVRLAAVLLVAKVPLIGHVQLPAALALALPPTLPGILGFHGGRPSTKSAR